MRSQMFIICCWAMLFIAAFDDVKGDSMTSVQQPSKKYWDVPVKDGECPDSDPDMHCSEIKDLCENDCQCPGKQKCCSQKDCGLSCKDPVGYKPSVGTCENSIGPSNKPGACPKSDNIVCVHCNDQCTSSCECPGEQICCKTENGCGNMCFNAV